MRMILTLLLLLAASDLTFAAESCVDCHKRETPGAVLQWQQSAHSKAEVGCADCHGSDHERLLAGEVTVDASICGKCHQQAYDQHSRSRHGLGLHAGWGCTRALPDRDQGECRFCHQEGSTLPISRVQCARFLKQSSEMGSLGCNRCHQVENNCASCHTNHLTAPEIVRDPKICAKCHMGPDHPQWEMWETSLHGTLFYSAGPEVGPSCQRCHMPENSHDVSQGLTAPPSMKPYPTDQLPDRRAAMVALCRDCHAQSFVADELAAADAIREQSRALVAEAEAIIHDLNDRNLLQPSPQNRPPHPQRGNQLVTDGQMLYEDYSHIERLFFKMKKFDLAKTVKGAYHQNPAWAHWYGNAELKMTLVDIKAEALRLKQVRAGGLVPLKESHAENIDQELKVLKKKYERGAIDEEQYRAEKQKLLDSHFGIDR